MKTCALIGLWVLLVGGAFALRAYNAGADPPLALSRSNAEITDAAWYLADAVRRARGLPDDPYDARAFSHYRKPLVTWTALPFFLGGVSLERAQLWAASWGLVLVAAAAGLARSVWGAPAAWFATLLVGFGYVFVGYGRAAVVYGPLAACMTAIAWLHTAAGRRAWLEGVAIALLVAVALFLKENAIVMLPALLVSSSLRLQRPGKWLLVAAFVGAPVLLALAWAYDPHLVRLGWGKLEAYVAGRGVLDSFKRWLRTPFASGLVEKAPLVAVLGWLGVLAAFRRSEAGGQDATTPQRRAEWLLAIWALVWFAFHGWFEYLEGGPPPMRHMVGGLVPLALLGAGVAGKVISRERLEAFTVHPLWWGIWTLLGAYWVSGSVWTFVARRWPTLLENGLVQALTRFEGLFATALVAAALASWWLYRRAGGRVQVRWSLSVRRAVLGALLIGVSVPAARRLDAMVLRPGSTLREANLRVAELLNEGAHVYGPWAHALTWSSPGARAHLPPHDIRSILERSTRMTHLAIDWAWLREIGRQYAHNGIELRLLERLSVRGHVLGVFLYPWATELGYRLSAAERERLRLRGDSESKRGDER